MGVSGGQVRCRRCDTPQYRPAWPVDCIHCSTPLTDETCEPVATAPEKPRTSRAGAEGSSNSVSADEHSGAPPPVAARFAREDVRGPATAGRSPASAVPAEDPARKRRVSPLPRRQATHSADLAEVASRAWDDAVTAGQSPLAPARAAVLRAAERLVSPPPRRSWVAEHSLAVFTGAFFLGPAVLWWLLAQLFPEGFNVWVFIGCYYAGAALVAVLVDKRIDAARAREVQWERQREIAAEPGLEVLRSRQAVVDARQRAEEAARQTARRAAEQREEAARLQAARQAREAEQAEEARRLADLRWDPQLAAQVDWTPLGPRPVPCVLPRIQLGSRLIVDGGAGEQLAGQWLRWLGAQNVRVTRTSRDGGVDVEADGLVAQMKAWVDAPVGTPVVQQIAGSAHVATGGLRRLPLVLTTSSFTKGAVHEADRIGVGLLVVDAERGHLVPVGRVGELVRSRGLTDPHAASG